MDLVSITIEAQRNMDVLALFICLCAVFQVYFVLLFLSLVGNYSWFSFMAHRTAVMCLLAVAFMGSLYIAYRCFSLNCASLMGICTIMAIIGYLFYLYYFDPFGLVMLPARMEKLYLLILLIFVFFGLVKMFLNMLGQGALLLHAHQAQLLMEQLRDAQGAGEPVTDKILIP